MVHKLSFTDAEYTCRALDEFATARSEKNPNKDAILKVQKTAGWERLVTIKLSEMPWYSRLIRWLGLGDATLTSVAQFLQNNEPYIPPSFSQLKDKMILPERYTDNGLDIITNVTEEAYNKLKYQKIRGCEIFKRCLSNHNSKHSCKVYMKLEENEKIDLRKNEYAPMSPGDHDIVRQNYRAPVIDKNQFTYLHPNDRQTETVPDAILGFCHEYGLGTPEDPLKAIEAYEKTSEESYSSCYNWALILEKSNCSEALYKLKKAEDILLGKINKNVNLNIFQTLSEDLLKICKAIADVLKKMNMDSSEYDAKVKKLNEHDTKVKELYDKAVVFMNPEV